jgi:hypothetical protein
MSDLSAKNPAGKAPDGRIMSQQKFRLITRSDFDGLVCAVLLREMDMIEEVLFVHARSRSPGAISPVTCLIRKGCTSVSITI